MMLLLLSVLLQLTCFGQTSSPLGNAINRFALDLYQEILNNLMDPTQDNIIYSPFSLSTALAMTHLGTAGNTSLQMEHLLHFSGLIDVPGQFKVLLKQLNQPGVPYTLGTANKLFPEQTFRILASYISAVTGNFGPSYQSLDFKNNPEQSRLAINDWVANNTEQKIQNLLLQGDVTDLTVLVLVNAIYFKATWLYQFEPKSTEKERFYVSPKSTMKVDMMKMISNVTKYGIIPTIDAKLIELPYTGEDLSMILILPNRRNELSRIETGLTIANLNSAIASMSIPRSNMKIWLPKFSTTVRYSMKEYLLALGMIDAFDMNLANFSALCGPCKQVYVSNAFHKAFIEVDEEGTEASAATAVGVTIKSPLPVFKADHPFMFLIRHKVSGAILFMGRIKTPPKAKHSPKPNASCISNKPCKRNKTSGKLVKKCCGCDYKFKDPKAKKNKVYMPAILLNKLKKKGRTGECMEKCVNTYCRKRYGP